jgi:hypothetical protein
MTALAAEGTWLQRIRSARAAMRGFGVTHVVVHMDRYQPARWDEVSRRLENAPELELVFRK